MSIAPIATTSSHQELQAFFQHRRSDLQQLAKDLQSGDLTTAQQDYQALQSLGQSGPFENGAPFGMANREHDFQNIGSALQSGDLAGARQAFFALYRTFVHVPATPSAVSASSPSPTNKPLSDGGINVSA